MKKLLHTFIALTVLTLSAPAQADWLENEHVFMEKGKLLYKSGRFDEALGPFSEAIRLNPQSSQAFFWRGIAFSSIHETKSAMDDLNQAIKIEPGQADYYISRGLLFANQNQHDLAIADFDHALQLNPTLSVARTNKQFSVSEIERQKKVAADKIANEKAEAERLAQKKAEEERIALEQAQNPKTKVKVAHKSVAEKTTTVVATTSGAALAAPPTTATVPTTTPTVKETSSERRGREERLAREKEQAERLAKEEHTARQKLEAESLAREKEFTEVISKEKAEREKMAAQLALVKQGAGALPKDDATPERPVRDKWALIVGISKFKDEHLNLHYPSKDAKDLYTFLTTEANFQKDHVHLLVDQDATRGRILSELGDKWLPRVASPDDLVVIYISSHGSASDMDVGGVNYLLAYDTEVDNLYSSGLPMQDLTRIIKGRVHSDRVVIMLDACHSGAATPDSKGLTRAANVNVDDVVQGTGQLVISSSQPNQVSWESKQDANSVFTKYLMEGLRANGSKTTLGDAFGYMKDKVQSHVLRERGVLQTPVLKSKWQGHELLLCAPASHPGPGLEVTAPGK